MSEESSNSSNYGLTSKETSATIAAPDMSYLPARPTNPPPIGLIGAGGISEYHLRAYKTLGFDVRAIANRTLSKAEARRDEFFPDARVTDDWRELVSDPELQVLDITPHPEVRLPMIEAALNAGKHVLSQKPFVENIADGERLCALAESKNLKLAVNQNGRFAPHFSWMRQVIAAGLIGELASIEFSLNWDHSWTADTPFDQIHHLLLADFGIHWFDIVIAFLGDQPVQRVFASVTEAPHQVGTPPYLAQVVAEAGPVQIRISMNAGVRHGQEDRTMVCGHLGTLKAWGPELNDQRVSLHTKDGVAIPELAGCWFENGFQGSMGELLCAIEEDRVPVNNARENLCSLAFCQAAVRSADTGKVAILQGNG